MHADGRPHRTLWLDSGGTLRFIDQTRLPHELVVGRFDSLGSVVHALRSMQVRGAPLIGVAACYGLWLALRDDASDAALDRACAELSEARPTAVNLRARVDEMRAALVHAPKDSRAARALELAEAKAADEVALSRSIAEHGYALLKALQARRPGAARPLNVLTHCNAGWLATVEWGTALAPVYLAHERGLPVHVWVDETRPRNQGYLTAWELAQRGVPHTLIVDNAGGHLMQHGQVDVCIVGTDRTTAAGDVCNKVGTYLKALAARDNQVPFYAAVPSSSIDWTLADGVREIPIEQRSPDEVHQARGRAADGSLHSVRATPEGTAVLNVGFDVTPARLLTGLITERGLCEASREGLLRLYPERG